MASIEIIKGSDGSGPAALATVQNTRSIGATTLDVDTVAGINVGGFAAAMGTPHTFTDPITSETITVISEDTCVEFTGHVDGSNLEIDDIAPGFSDLGSAVGDVVMIRPTTQYADNLAEVLATSLDDDGTMKATAIYEGIGTNGVLGAEHIYTSGATWTKPANLKFIVVEVQAGGGGGGGAANTTGAACGGGGGAGGYSRKRILAASLGSTETVTVGAAGTGATAGNNSGGNGGNSSFGSHATANGGVAGTGMQSETGNRVTSGGAGGTAASGDINTTGQNGATGRVQGGWPWGADGGDSPLGSGGVWNTGAALAGNAGTGYGAGGGGGVGFSDNVARAGGAGAAGVVIVREYY